MEYRAPPSVPPRMKKHLTRFRRKLQALIKREQSSDAVVSDVLRELEAIKRDLQESSGMKADTQPSRSLAKDLRPIVSGILMREVIEWLRRLRDTCNSSNPFMQRRNNRCLPLVRPSSASAALAA